MATLKYKTPEGEWKKVSIGGGGSTEEVYVGSDAPTDENVKVWIDPTGTPSAPSAGGDENIYLLPIGLFDATGDEYEFSAEEAVAYRGARDNHRNVIFRIEREQPDMELRADITAYMVEGNNMTLYTFIDMLALVQIKDDGNKVTGTFNIV